MRIRLFPGLLSIAVVLVVSSAANAFTYGQSGLYSWASVYTDQYHDDQGTTSASASGSSTEDVYGNRATSNPNDCYNMSSYYARNNCLNNLTYVNEDTGIDVTSNASARAVATSTGALKAKAQLSHQYGEDDFSAEALSRAASVFTVTGTPNGTGHFYFDLTLTGSATTTENSAVWADGKGQLQVAVYDPGASKYNLLGYLNSKVIGSEDGAAYTDPASFYQSGEFPVGNVQANLNGGVPYIEFDLQYDNSGIGKIWVEAYVEAKAAEDGSFSYGYNYNTNTWTSDGNSGSGTADFSHTLTSFLFVPDDVEVAGTEWSWDWASNFHYGNPGQDTGSGTGGDVPVPEPSTWLLLGTGLAGLAFWRRRNR